MTQPSGAVIAGRIRWGKDFIMRGDVVGLAIAFVSGFAFAASMGTFRMDFIGTIGSETLINFVILAAISYFVVIVPIKRLDERRRSGAEEPEELTGEEQLLSEIRDLLTTRG